MSPRRSKLPLLARLTALTSAALVLLLTILAASPAWHAALHGATDRAGHPHDCRHHSGHDRTPLPETPDSGDELCIVTQFARGHAEPGVVPVVLTTPLIVECRDSALSLAVCAPSAPAHILPPGCGPPSV